MSKSVIELIGKLTGVKVKPECGELDTADVSVEDTDDGYKKIAWLVQTGAEIEATIKTPGPGSSGPNLIKTRGKVKSAVIKPEGCLLKYDGFDFTPDQYRRLAEIVKSDLTTIFSIEPTQGEFDF